MNISKKADVINLAKGGWDVEEEFRLAKNHTSLNKLKKTPDCFWEIWTNFSPRPVTLQPEIENPENFPPYTPTW